MVFYAILKGHEVVPVDDCLQWAKWMERIRNRTIAKNHVGTIEVSTVFLGINHGFMGKNLWFETMIFGGKHDQYQRRYQTWKEAEVGHKEAFDLVLESSIN